MSLDAALRMMSAFTSAQRVRAADKARAERDGDPGRDDRVAAHLNEIRRLLMKVERELEN